MPVPETHTFFRYIFPVEISTSFRFYVTNNILLFIMYIVYDSFSR